MKKQFCFIILFSVFIASLFCEIKYIEIDSIKNVPVIEIKMEDDFEAIINDYGIRIGYLIKNGSETTLYVIADSVYFSFPLKGYYSLSDYRNGKSKKFVNGADYNTAMSLGLDTSEIYYYYTRNSFSSVDDCKDAYKNGFVNIKDDYNSRKDSDIYYAAKKAGYSNYSDYKEFVEFNRAGFKNKSDWQVATQKGFTKGAEYYSAIENGFENYIDFNSARTVGITINEDYVFYIQTIASFEKIMKEQGLAKNKAVIYHHIQKLPKGDIGLSALSNSLMELYSNQSKNVTDAINLWYSDIKSIEETKTKGRNDYYTQKRVLIVTSIFSQNELNNFFTTVDVSSLGTYNSKTEIFRRK